MTAGIILEAVLSLIGLGGWRWLMVAKDPAFNWMNELPVPRDVQDEIALDWAVDPMGNDWRGLV
jgi:hypothetical protein